jgi:hypothetical protein
MSPMIVLQCFLVLLKQSNIVVVSKINLVGQILALEYISTLSF